MIRAIGGQTTIMMLLIARFLPVFARRHRPLWVDCGPSRPAASAQSGHRVFTKAGAFIGGSYIESLAGWSSNTNLADQNLFTPAPLIFRCHAVASSYNPYFSNNSR